MTESFAKDFGKVHGIDISPTMTDIAKRRLGHLPNVEFVATGGTMIPFPDNTFDLVFSYLVFPHIDSADAIERYLEEVRRTLKPGGVAKIQFRTGPGVRRWVWSYGISLTEQDAVTLATRPGLRVVDARIEDQKNLWLILSRA